MSQAYTPKTKFGIWLDKRLPIARFFYENFLNFTTPRNLNYLYSFGAILIFMLLSQIFSGIIMAMHYVPHIDMAFSSKEYMKHMVNYGWLFTNVHSVGASFFFIAAYIHIARGLYYGSYKQPREMVWFLGIFIYFIMLFIAFTGSILDYTMMSKTAALVISNFIEQIPLFGPSLKYLMLGGVVVGQPTLNRLYILHIVVPFILCLFIILHLWAIHVAGQSNPLGIKVKTVEDTNPFMPKAMLKDILAIAIFALIFAIFVFYMPNIMQDEESFVANNDYIVTNHMAPQWYFLPFYSMLRAIDFNIGSLNSAFISVMVVSSALILLFFVPYLDKSSIHSAKFRPYYRIFFWLFICDIVLLAYLAKYNVNALIITLSKIATFYYFSFFIIIMPLLPKFETTPNLPNSINEYMQTKKSSYKFKLW